jgi:hypothetical protein
MITPARIERQWKVVGIIGLLALQLVLQAAGVGNVYANSSSNNGEVVWSAPLFEMKPDLTNAPTFMRMCSSYGYLAVVRVAGGEFGINKNQGNLGLTLNNCHEIRITPWPYPVVGIFSLTNEIITSYGRMAGDVTHLSIERPFDGGQQIIEVAADGSVTSGNEKKRKGHVPRAVFRRFCASLEVLNVGTMQNGAENYSGDARYEVCIYRGPQVQRTQWITMVDEGEHDDDRFGMLSLLADGFLSRVKWQTPEEAGSPIKGAAINLTSPQAVPLKKSY